jgi:hypothetical protein
VIDCGQGKEIFIFSRLPFQACTGTILPLTLGFVVLIGVQFFQEISNLKFGFVYYYMKNNSERMAVWLKFHENQECREFPTKSVSRSYANRTLSCQKMGL